MEKRDYYELECFAARNNVKVIDRGGGHIQLKGKLLVNYYPDSKKKTAYIAGMNGGAKQVATEKAVLMANEPPFSNGFTEKRKGNYKGSKNKLLKKHPFCCWCGEELNTRIATLEHIIPLSRGGLNNMNNYALACEPCNSKRGSDMPELEGKNDLS